MRVTDRQTDGQTDRILIARLHLHCMQSGKNGQKHYVMVFNENIKLEHLFHLFHFATYF